MQVYFDCFSGISGDMTLGAFIDLGVPLNWLKDQLTLLPLAGFDITVSDIKRNGIHAKNVFVHDDIHAHPMDYKKIRSLIETCPHSEWVKKTSLAIFEKIADAESKIHDCPKKNVHFHEVGGIDAMVDIVGTALCMEYLGITRVTSSKIPLGSGFVKCMHGVIPLPAPATVEILNNIPVYGTDVQKELVTPTGAAIIATLADSFGHMPPMVVKKTGYGSGKRNLEDRPNLLRVIAGDVSNQVIEEEKIVVVETTIDDMNPEIYGYLMERLFDDGALDVCWQPVYMKKNRPGIVVTVLCTEEKRKSIIHRLLSETTSAGVRFFDARRSLLARKAVEIDSCYGKVTAKQIERPDGSVHIVPEYEVCRNIALEKKIPLREVFDKIT